MNRRSKHSSPKNLYLVSTIIMVGFFALLAIASIFLQKKVQEQDFDVRQQAWERGNPVLFGTNPSAGTSFQANEPNSLDLTINTDGHAVSAVEFNFSINRVDDHGGRLFPQNIEFEPANNTQITAQSVTPSSACDECYDVNLLISNSDPTQPLVTQNDITVARLNFTPQPDPEGQFELAFSESYALDFNTQEDILNFPDDWSQSYSFVVTDSQDELNPVSWRTNYAYLEADDFYIMADGKKFTGRGLITQVDSNPYNQNGDYTTLEIRTWTEHNVPMRFYLYFYRGGPNWWASELRTYDGTTSSNQVYFTSQDYFTTPLNQEFTYNGELILTSDDSSVTIHLTNPRIQAFTYQFTDDHCGNGFCESWYGEDSDTCSADCTTATNSCPAPTDIGLEIAPSCNDNGELTLNVTWDAVPQATEYLFYAVNVDLDLNQEPEILETTTSPNYTIQDVADGSWYIMATVFESDGSCTANGVFKADMYHEHDCQTNQACEYQNCTVGDCTDGYQERTCYLTAGDENSCDPSITDSQRCLDQCHWQCSDWSECTNGWQTRTCTQEQPPSCWWYEQEAQPETSRYCGANDIDLDSLFTYSYEACWYGNSSGVSSYVIWDNNVYPEATWIDISPDNDFASFAHKEITNQSNSFYDHYLVTDLTGFYWAGTDDLFTLEPGRTYYLRLFNSSQHSHTVTFYMPRCAGEGSVSYRQCNESCNHNNECAGDLYCYQGRCRLPDNPTSNICAYPPDQGLNRTCNEYCADTRECADGYSCWYNRCRNPRNLEDQLCREPAQVKYIYHYSAPATPLYTTYTTKGGETYRTSSANQNVQYVKANANVTTVGCNQSCQSNRNCEPNHRCYQGSCRLAINPESQICDPYDKPSAKGGSTTSDSQTQTGEASTETQATTSPMPTLAAGADSGQDQDSSSTKPVSEQTALDALKEYLKDKNLSLPLVIGGGLVGLILLIVLISLVSKNDSNNQGRSSQLANLEKLRSTSQNKSAPPSSMLNRMQQKGVKTPGQGSTKSSQTSNNSSQN